MQLDEVRINVQQAECRHTAEKERTITEGLAGGGGVTCQSTVQKFSLLDEVDVDSKQGGELVRTHLSRPKSKASALPVFPVESAVAAAEEP